MDSDRQFVESNFPDTMGRELFRFISEKRIGSGVGRTVYEYRMNKADTVIKIEENSCSFQNILEWEAWLTFRETAFGKKWLAPCIRISACGIYLLQARTRPPGPTYKWPKKLPYIMTDRKRENFGILNGRLVLHDYGTLHIGITKSANLARHDAAKFWNASDTWRAERGA